MIFIFLKLCDRSENNKHHFNPVVAIQSIFLCIRRPFLISPPPSFPFSFPSLSLLPPLFPCMMLLLESSVAFMRCPRDSSHTPATPALWNPMLFSGFCGQQAFISWRTLSLASSVVEEPSCRSHPVSSLPPAVDDAGHLFNSS